MKIAHFIGAELFLRDTHFLQTRFQGQTSSIEVDRSVAKTMEMLDYAIHCLILQLVVKKTCPA